MTALKPSAIRSAAPLCGSGVTVVQEVLVEQLVIGPSDGSTVVIGDMITVAASAVTVVAATVWTTVGPWLNTVVAATVEITEVAGGTGRDTMLYEVLAAAETGSV